MVTNGKEAKEQLAIARSWIRTRLETWCLRVFLVLLFLPILRFVPGYSNFKDEEWTLDWRMQDRYENLLKEQADPQKTTNRKQSSPIIVLLVDDEAIRQAKISDPSPLPRNYLARVVWNVAQRKPKVIGIDFFLDCASSDPAQDEALRRALKYGARRTMLVLATLPRKSSYKDDEQGLVLPIEDFLCSRRVWIGRAMLGVESDESGQTVRDVQLFKPVACANELPAGPGNTCYVPSFAGIVAWLYWKEITDRGHEITDQGDEQTSRWCFNKVGVPGRVDDLAEVFSWQPADDYKLIDFSAPPGRPDTFQIYSTADLLAGKVPSLEDKIVLIGAGYHEAEDQHRTPLSSRPFGRGQNVREKMFGVEVHAYAVATLLNAAACKGGYLTPYTSGFKACLFAFIGGVCLYLLIGKWPFIFRLMITGFIVFVYWQVAFECFLWYRLWLPLLRPIALFIVLAAWISKETRKPQPTDGKEWRPFSCLITLPRMMMARWRSKGQNISNYESRRLD